MIIALVTIPLVVRAIGVEQLGLVDLSLSVMYTLCVFVAYGYNLSGPRDIAQQVDRPRQVAGMLATVLTSKMVLASALLLVVAIVGIGTAFIDGIFTILLFSTTLLVAEVFQLSWLAQGYERMHIILVGNVLSKLAYLGLLIVWVREPSDSFLVNFLLGLSTTLVNLIVAFVVIRRWGIGFATTSFDRVSRSLRENFYLFLSSIAGYVSINSGMIILGFFASPFLLGAYSLADRVVRVLRIVPTILIQAIYPKASRLYVGDKHAFNAFLRKSYAVSLFLCLVTSFATYVAAPLIIEFLASRELPEAVKTLRIIAFVPFFASLNVGNMILVLVADKKKALLKTTWMSFILMMVVCTLMTKFFGPYGLGFGLLATELAIFGIQLYFNIKVLPRDTLNLYLFRAGKA